MHIRKPFALAAMVLATPVAQTAELQCAGKVTQVNLHANDTFMVQLESMNAPVFFCKPNAAWTVAGTPYTTSAETCRALIAVFLAAKAQDRAFSVVYFDGDEVPASCNSWTQWRSANIRYFLWAD